MHESGPFFAECEHLFQRARAGGETEIGKLHALVVPRLVAWLKQRRLRLLPCELEDASEDAFSEAVLAFPTIPRWAQALVFCRRVEFRQSVKRSVKMRRFVPLPPDFDREDPRSWNALQTLDVLDLLEALARELSADQFSTLLSLARDALPPAGKSGSLGEERDVCERTWLEKRRMLRKKSIALLTRLILECHET